MTYPEEQFALARCLLRDVGTDRLCPLRRGHAGACLPATPPRRIGLR